VRFGFGEFVLDLERRQLLAGAKEIPLSPQALELLRLLLENRPRALSKRELHEHLWPSTFVLDANLAVLISDIRAALGDLARRPKFIRTVHRFGYAFTGEAVVLPPLRAARAQPDLSCWMVWENREFPLQDGENIIGRHPQAAVCFNLPGVSRRHARISIAGDPVLEDLGSKNGTYVNGRRVTRPTCLNDGDEIGVGSVMLIFRSRPVASSTETQADRSPVQPT
jgi:DNA-binding winged helix-turn-helix (wHTH) protein